jgi:ribosomal protein S18 acetylase RimI-like enzyme
VELRAVEFSAKHLPRVQHFECRSSLSAEFAADWIKQAPPAKGALRSIQDYGNEVWLYYAANRRDLIGFSSLGTTRWRIPPPDGPRREAGFLPMLAVASRFQGKMAEPGKRRYSDLILYDTIAKARERQFRELCLFVHEDNIRALRLYTKHGFEIIGETDQRGLIRMLKLLE